jgi:outer membrane autotransporter protein
MRSTDVDTHTAIVYGEYKPSNWYVNGIATYGWSDYEESKNVAGVGVKADYDVETFGLQAMTGYDMNINGLCITPENGLRYVHIKQDAYKDSADQRVSANDSDILTGVIGAKISKNFELSNGMNIKPEARIAATYDLFNDDVNSVVTLANGSAYAVEGEALDRFGMEFGAGVTAEVNDKVELSFGYEGKFREDYQDHTGLINAKYKF